MTTTSRRSGLLLVTLGTLCAGAIPSRAVADSAATSVAAASLSGMVTGTLDVRFDGLRSAKGLVRACLTRNPAFFPQCDRDPAAFKATVPAANPRMAFRDVPAGDYALTVLHDENSNARVDTLLGIPREGVGFSRNPAIRFGPPSFAASRFQIGGGTMTEDIRLKYFF